MTHQTYLDMLFEDPEDLSHEQALSLENHLASCRRCQEMAYAIKSVDLEMHRSEMAEPQPGFALRFQDRLLVKQHLIHQKQVRLTFGVVAAGLFILGGIFVIFSWPLLRSPSLLAWTAVYQLYVMFTYLDVLEGFVSLFFNVSYSAIPLITYFFFVGFISELAVLWVVSYRLLTNPRRITQ